MEIITGKKPAKFITTLSIFMHNEWGKETGNLSYKAYIFFTFT